jgi:endonuclease III-like uncharacterized protein
MLSKDMNIFKSPLKNQLKCHSQNFLSVLFSILNDSSFLELSDIGILRALQENDKNSIPNVSYQCSIKFLIDELKRYYNKNQKQENQIVKNLGGDLIEFFCLKELQSELSCSHGVASKLFQDGLISSSKVRESSLGRICSIKGIGKETAEKLLS